MDVTLSPKVEEVVRQKLETGDYTSVGDVLEESVRLLQKRDDQWAEEVRRKIDEAREQQRNGRILTAEESRARMDAFKAEWKKQHRKA